MTGLMRLKTIMTLIIKAQDKQKQQDLADALIGGDEKQILAARAAYDPVGTANYLDQQQQQQQAREWALADAERNHQWIWISWQQ